MSGRKTVKTQCIIFKKGLFTKSDAFKWCTKNKEKYGLKTYSETRRCIKRIDGDFILIIRPRYKFKNVKVKNSKGIKISTGLLK